MTRTTLLAACLGAVVALAAAPAPQTLTPAAVEEAFRIGRTRRPSELDQFTTPYIVTRGGPGSPTVEVITEFRRAVLLTRQQADFGNYSWTTTNLTRALAKYEGLTTVRAEIWLSPVHQYVGTPTYRMDAYDAARNTVMPVEEKREPIFNAVITGETSAMTGVTLETIYRDAVLREKGCCLLLIVDPKGETVVRKQVEFGVLR